MRVSLILVPYHLGHEGTGMGAGPDRLLEAGAARSLERAGHEVEVERVERREQPANEIAASFEVVRLVAEHVRRAVQRGAFPLVLSGNCMSSLGVVAGVGGDVGVVWLDAHPDFNTAETTTSGFADGMGLSMLTGTGWNELRATIPGYRALAEASVVLVGIRELDPPEEERLTRSAVAAVRPTETSDRLTSALDGLRERASDVYLHLDLDVLDPSEGRANEYAAPGGLTAGEVAGAVKAVGERFRVRAAAVTAYNPACDPEGAVAETALGLLVQIVETGEALPTAAGT